MSEPIFDDLMRALGEADPRISTVLRHDECRYTLDYDDAAMVQIELDPARGVAVLQAEAGQLPPDAGRDTLQALLAYNALWRETGGVRLGLTGSRVQLLYDLPLAALDLPRLAGTLANLAEKAGIWSDFLQRPDASPSVTAVDFGLRV